LGTQVSRADVVFGGWTDRGGERHPGDARHLEHAMTTLAVQTWDTLTRPRVARCASASSAIRTPEPGPDAVTGTAAPAVARALGAEPDAVVADHGVAGPLLALLRAAAGRASDPEPSADRTTGPESETGRTAHVLALAAGRVLGLAVHVDPGTPGTPGAPGIPGPLGAAGALEAPGIPGAAGALGAPGWRPDRETHRRKPRDTREARAPVEAERSPLLSLPSSSPFFQRSSRELLRLEGARCLACGTVMFPPSQRPVCSGCQGYAFEPVPLSRTGTVHTYVVNRFLPDGFGDEMALVLGQMDDGSRYWAPTSGIRAGELAIGDPVELRLRRFTDHGGAPVYAMKFVGAGV
jgi:uncharacterized OB-fold protein